MDNRFKILSKYGLIFFVLMCVFQLFFPVKMIWQQQNIVKNGEKLKFEIRPVDPRDPFRGEYLQLNFDQDNFKVPTIELEDWQKNKKIYVHLIKDINDFVQLTKISEDPPVDNNLFFIAKVSFTISEEKDSSFVNITYPFDRLYLTETEAKKAEDKFRSLNVDNFLNAHAELSCLSGNCVLLDLIIQNKSIHEWIKE